MQWKIDATNAAGMDIDVPFRLCLSQQEPSVRAPWFSVKQPKDEVSIQDIFSEQMMINRIPFVIIGNQLWFVWTDHWCRYDAFVDEDEIKFYLLAFRNSGTS